jgi:membrane-associated protein
LNPALNWFDAQGIIEGLGALAVLGVAALIFAETATILGSFLPGDSLLFLLGLTLSTALTGVPLVPSMLVVFIAAIIGSEVGYWLGHKFGPRVFRREDTWFFNKKVVEKTKEFYQHYGARAIVLARFIPVLRALVPLTVGMSDFGWRRYLVYNIAGALLWVGGLMTAGYFLGTIPFVQHNIEWVVIGFIVLSSLPLPIEIIRNRMKKSRS